ncbi:DUF2946 family protein [Methylocystis sp. MJC1]|uniref:DUF2946 family protein n=1 Tax=Methylocystis sp. MJC1 TaxID=2654282 RepID=UPI0034D563B7
MDPNLKRESSFTRLLATIVASLLLLQLSFASAPALAAANLDVICSTQDAPIDNGWPAVPHGGHRHGLCCILHCGSLGAPPPKTYAAIRVPISPATTIELPPTRSAPERRMEPKRAPQSPRAPPSQARAVSA